MSPIDTSSTSRWTAYAAWTHLRNHPRQPAVDTVRSTTQRLASAEQTVAGANLARSAPLRPGHTLDVTV